MPSFLSRPFFSPLKSVSAKLTAPLFAAALLLSALNAQAYNITMVSSPSAGGSTSPSGGPTDQSSPLAITATPSAGYRFGSWSGTAGITFDSSTSASTNANFATAGTITASFVKTYTLTMAVSGPGSVTPPVTGNPYTCDAGVAVSVTATPTNSNAYGFAGWTISSGTGTFGGTGGGIYGRNDGSIGPPAQPQTIALTSDVTLTATFTPLVKITIDETESLSQIVRNVRTGEKGTWAFSTDSRPVTINNQTYVPSNYTIVITASPFDANWDWSLGLYKGSTDYDTHMFDWLYPASGFSFATKFDDPTHYYPTSTNLDNPVYVNLTADCTFTARFRKKDHYLTVNTVGGGSVYYCTATPSVDLDGYYHTSSSIYQNETQTIVAVPAPKWSFVGWLAYDGAAVTDTSSAGATTTVKLASKSGMITALFEYDGSNFSGTPAGCGYNNYSQIGDGTVINRTSPVEAASVNVTNLMQVASGTSHTVALKSDGTVWAWGYNANGQLGDGTNDNSTTPVQVLTAAATPLTDIVQIACGENHCLALKSPYAAANPGTVWAWGFNGSGQLGDGTTNDSSYAVQVSSISNIAQIAAGGNHSMALESAGSTATPGYDSRVWTWGLNANGQLGHGSSTQVPQSSTPVNVILLNANAIPVNLSYLPTHYVNLSFASQITAGAQHSMALTRPNYIDVNDDGTFKTNTSGKLLAWGGNVNGQLGNNTQNDNAVPTYSKDTTGSSDIIDVSQVAAGGWHSLAVKPTDAHYYEGAVLAWGFNGSGQLGNGTTTNSKIPVQATGLTDNVIQICGGKYHSLAIKNDFWIWSWGDNFYGQLGNNSLTNNSTPGQMYFFPTSASLGVGCLANHSMSLGYSQVPVAMPVIGVGTVTVDSSTVSAVAYVTPDDSHTITAAGDSGWTFVQWQCSAGVNVLDAYSASTSFTLRRNGTDSGNNVLAAVFKFANDASSWGLNRNGQLGNGTTTDTNVPVSINGLSAMSQLSAGETHTLALKSDGTVWACGYNTRGQLGDNTTIQRTSPVQVLGVGGTGNLTNIIQVSAGEYHSLALGGDGKVYAWGFNNYGQLGDNTTVERHTPVRVQYYNRVTDETHDLTKIVQISAGDLFNLALDVNGYVWAWGCNNYGQLGDGTKVTKLLPVAVVNSATDPTYFSGVTQISAGFGHSLALKSGGAVHAWGLNSSGQLGNNSTAMSSVPVQVVGVGGTGFLSSITQIAAGAQHSLALTSTNGVCAWGFNGSGQLGNNSTTRSTTPVQVKGSGGSGFLTNITYIAAGSEHCVARCGDGSFYAWGLNSNGQLGNNQNGTGLTAKTPVQVKSFTSAGVKALVYGGSGAVDSLGLGTLNLHNLTMAVNSSSGGTVVPPIGSTVVNELQVVDIIATPATYWTFDSWTVGSGNAIVDTPSSASTTAHLPQSGTDSTIIAGFKKVQRALTMAVSPASSYGSTTPVVGSSQVNLGEPYSIIANPNTNYQFVSWTSSTYATVADTTSASTTVTLTETATVTANFAKIPCSLTMSANPSSGGTVTRDPGTIYQGVPLTIYATAATNYSFNGWTVSPSNGASFSSPSSATTTATPLVSAVTLTAAFAPASVDLTMVVAPSGKGTTVPGAGAHPGYAVIGQAYPISATVTDSNYQFSNWTCSGGATVASPSSANTTATLTSNGSVTANFTQKQVTLTMAVIGSGTTSPSGTSTVNQGESFSISATAGTNYQFSNWTCSGGASVTSQTSASTNAVLSAAGTITANFTKIPRTLTMAVNNSAFGSVTPASGPVNQGDPVVINATAAANYEFTSWTVTDSATLGGSSSANPNTVTLAGDSAVTANFSRIQRMLTMTVSGSGSTSPNIGSVYVDQGTAQTIIATAADANWTFTGWRATSGAVIADTSKSSTTATLSADSIVTAGFKCGVPSAAWGLNTYGQIGNGATGNVSVATLISGLSDMSCLAAGENHSLGLKSDGTVRAWGLNSSGQLGNGTTTNSSVPVQTSSLSSVTGIAAGANHSLALKSDGTVWAWGVNTYGQLGDNTKTARTSPVLVLNTTGTGYLTGIVDIAAGESHSLALTSAGNVCAWGLNSSGQLGNGTTTDSKLPVQTLDDSGAAALSGISGLAAGSGHSIALKSDGTVWAWGLNAYGQLGDNTTVTKTLPVQVKDSAGTGTLSGIAQVSAGFWHSAALKSDGTAVWAWGYNGSGQLGNGTTTSSNLPVQVKDSAGTGTLSGVSQIACGKNHSLALAAAGNVWAWGSNASGQLGNGTTTDSLLPAAATSFAGAEAAVSGCAAGHSLGFGDLSQVNMTMAASGSGTTVPSSGTITAVFKNVANSISATPASNWQFDTWSASSGATFANTTSASTTVTMTADNTVTASFSKIMRTLTMAVSGSGATTPPAGSSSVPQGEAQSISATPVANWQFDNWTVTGGATVASATSASTTATLTADGSVTANFSKIQRTLTMAKSGSGTITPDSGAHSVNQGEANAVTAVPASNWQFDNWTADGGAVVADTSAASTSATLSASGTVTANFSKIQRTLTMAVSPASSGTTEPPVGSKSVNQGEASSIIAAAAANYQFSHWSAAGGAVVADTSSASTTATLSSNGTVTANFTGIMRTLTMAVSGSGTTSPSAGSSSVQQGVPQNITAAAGANWRFANWTATSGAAVADTSSASTTATLSSSATVTAAFARIQWTLTMAVSPASSGTTSPLAGSSSVNQGDSVAVLATPAVGYKFSSWTAGGGAIVDDSSKASTTVALTADGTLTANFAKIQSQLTMAVSPSGTGFTSPSVGTSWVNQGENINITALPCANWRFSGWTSTASATVADKTKASTTAMLIAGATITASFTYAPYGDYNSDGRSDIVLRNNAAGQGLMWLMNGLSVQSSGEYCSGGNFIAAASGDFNNDGFADLVMRDTVTGTAQIWLMRGTSVQSKITVYDGGDTSWRVIGTGDFDGDGYCDILWQNESTAQAVIYLMSGTSLKQWGFIYDGSAPVLRAVGTGDFAGTGKCGIVWRNSSTGAVPVWLMNGFTVSASAVIYDGSDSNWLVVGTGDYNGDGKCDIAWRNSASTSVLLYLMSGITVAAWGMVYDGSLGNDWRFAGSGDINGDGRYDMLLQSSAAGNVSGYLLNGTTVISSGAIYSGGDPNLRVAGFGDIHNASLTIAVNGSGTTVPSAGTTTVVTGETQTVTALASSGYSFKNWTLSGYAWLSSTTSASATLIVYGPAAALTANFERNTAAVSDFNADGKSDLLWRNTSNGYAAMWLMNGAQPLNLGIIFDSDKTWIPVGKGDFNGDGYCDIIWQRSTNGATALWYMNGLSMIGSAYLRSSSSETVIGVGDFNGDGYADVLWRGVDGAVYMDLLKGSEVIGSSKIFEPGSTWIPCGTGDYNGDGKCDILWRDTSNGDVAMWLMNGLIMTDGRKIFIGAGGWTPRSCGDYNGDGKCDIAWQDSTGTAVVWLMNGLNMISYGYIYQGGDTAWKIMDSGDYDGDGKADITWRNDSTGQVVIYFMNGVTVKSWAVIFSGDVSWTIVK